MKKNTIKSIIILLICSVAMRSNGQGCQPPENYMQTPSNGLDAMGGMEQYLSRAIMVNDYVGYVSWAVYYNDPFHQHYIDRLADMKAMFIRRAAGLWGSEDNLIDPFFHNGCQRMIQDINNTYTLANLRLPLIEACIFEVVSDRVNGLTIPNYVKTAFATDPDYTNYVSTHGGAPTNFIQGEMVMPGSDMPDINKILTRLWFYYAATNYIDLGFNVLHVGNISPYTVNDPGVIKTNTLFKMMRTYAHDKKKVLLINADVEKDIYVNNDNYTLLLDFNSGPIRIDESRNSTSPDYQDPRECQPNSWQSGNVDYAGLECDGQYMGELNFYKYQRDLVNGHGGLAPSGCVYDKTPKSFSFDWGPTPENPPRALHKGWLPWGVDEFSWFANLKPNCQIYFLKTVADQIKNDAFYRGYLCMPGKMALFTDINGHPYTDWQDNEWNVFPNQPPGDWHIQDNPAVLDMVKTLWEPNYDLNFTITEKCVADCSAKTASEGGVSGVYGHKKYTLRITNPDVSSIYTWHVHKPDDSWLPFIFGQERVLEGLPSGMYGIGVRQDNLGFPCPKDAQFLEKFWCINNESCFLPTPNENGTRNKFLLPSTNSFENFGTENLMDDKTTEIYPNPTDGKINVKLTLTDDGVYNAFLSDISGKKITNLFSDRKFEKGVNVDAYDLPKVAPGTYFVVIESNGVQKVHKLTIVK